MDAQVNCRNSRLIAQDRTDALPVFQTKNPASLIVFGAAASDGSVLNPHFIAAGLMISTKKNLYILKTSLLL